MTKTSKMTATKDQSEEALNAQATNEPIKSPPTVTAPLMCSSRLTITVMMFFGCLMTYILRLNMGFAMVCMVKKEHHHYPSIYYNTSLDYLNMTSTASPVQDTCSNLSPKLSQDANSTEHEESTGEFVWEKSLQGMLLGSFFYGYILTQVLAGWLCERIGGRIVLAVGLGVCSALTLVLPVAARFNPYAMLSVRVVQGAFAAVSFPAIHTLVGNWAPPTEAGLLMSLSYSGMYVGTLINFPLCGLLCKYGFDGGWPSVFYVTGIMGLLYVLVLLFTVYNGYESHPRISPKERMYLEKTLIGHHDSGHAIKIPWCKFVTSLPVLAITVAHVCGNWGLYTLVINLPLYMKEVLKFDIKQNGFLSSLPYICTLVVNLACGKLSDWLRNKNCCSFTVLRKILNSIGMFIPSVCMLSITFLTCQERYWAVAAVTACQAMSGFAYAGGFFYNHGDLAPQHAGILMGITNMFATIPGILSPLLVGLITPNGTKEEWSVIFYIGAAMYAFGGIFYLLFASADRQPWSYAEDEETHNKDGNEHMLLDDSNKKSKEKIDAVSSV